MTRPALPEIGALTVRSLLELFVHAWVARRITPPLPLLLMVLAREPACWLMPTALSVKVLFPTLMVALVGVVPPLLLFPKPKMRPLIEKSDPSVVLMFVPMFVAKKTVSDEPGVLVVSVVPARSEVQFVSPALFVLHTVSTSPFQ